MEKSSTNKGLWSFIGRFIVIYVIVYVVVLSLSYEANIYCINYHTFP